MARVKCGAACGMLAVLFFLPPEEQDVSGQARTYELR
jgi:hypothetical protein